MSLEFDLLAYCSGLARGIPTLMAMAAPEARIGLDETRFIALAKQHKVESTTYAGLKKAGINLSPEGMRSLAHEAAVSRATRSLLLRDWREIVAGFKAESIRALTIKGPASSIQLYGDPLIREYYDLDILADIVDIQPILPMMAKLGYEPSDPAELVVTSVDGGLLAQQPCHHISFQKKDRPFRIEIHGKTWQEDKEFSAQYIEETLRRAVPLGQGFGDTLNMADHVLFMIAHGTQHAWCSLHWLLDLAAALDRNDETMHSTLAGRIRTMHMERQLKLACMVVRRVYPVTIPEPLQDIIDSVRAPLKVPFRFALARLNAGGKDQATLKSAFLDAVIFQPYFANGATRKAQHILHPFLTPQIDVVTLHLPKPLHFLYLPLRPFFVLSRRWKRWLGNGGAHAT
jgi:hypothetical protein